MLHYNASLSRIFIFCKITWIFFPALYFVPSNICVGPSPKFKKCFFLDRKTHTYSKNYTIFTKPNPIPYPEYYTINIIIFSHTNCTKETILQCWITAYIKIFTDLVNNAYIHCFCQTYVILSCLKQLPLNFTLISLA